MLNQVQVHKVDWDTFARAQAHGRGPVRAVFNHIRREGYLYQDGFYWEAPRGSYLKVTKVDYLLGKDGQRVKK